MKGFIRVLESIIASLVILSSITFFLSVQRPISDQRTQFNYVLAALHKNGSLDDSIASNNIAALNTTLKDTLPPTVDFSVEILGIPNPLIKVACACSDADKSTLSSRLSPLVFTYISRAIEIRIDNGNFPVDGDLSKLININPDILFFFGYRTFSPAEKALLEKFLQNGTLFMLSDLQDAQVSDGVMDQLFGLTPGPSSAQNGNFIDTQNAGSASYRISRYYASLGGNKGDLFVPRAAPLIGQNKIAVDSRTIVGDPLPSPIRSLVKINKEIIESNGRTVWFINYDSSGDITKMNMLLKASVLWASGERYSMDPQSKIIPTVQSFRQYNYIGVLDGFEPFMAALKIWGVFY